jgi:hypothetical protein
MYEFNGRELLFVGKHESSVVLNFSIYFSTKHTSRFFLYIILSTVNSISSFCFTKVLEAYQDHPKLSSQQFYDLLITIHQTLSEAVDAEEKFDELLKYIDSQQPQVLIQKKNKTMNQFYSFFLA